MFSHAVIVMHLIRLRTIINLLLHKLELSSCIRYYTCLPFRTFTRPYISNTDAQSRGIKYKVSVLRQQTWIYKKSWKVLPDCRQSPSFWQFAPIGNALDWKILRNGTSDFAILPIDGPSKWSFDLELWKHPPCRQVTTYTDGFEWLWKYAYGFVTEIEQKCFSDFRVGSEIRHPIRHMITRLNNR